ncbi:MAG TPA: mannose-1-phosphate guanylyltransferase [Phycisphaerales bacterium]|nr:mannose-1-phosphate guanylyltransferase [Phycisphaerales bacterium]
MRYAMIMAGGAGTRLWPMSRNARPKQLLPLITPGPGRHTRTLTASDSRRPLSLLEIAAARVEGLVPPERRFICTGEAFRAQIRDSLPAFSDDRILGEPVGRDTVNAVGFAAAVFQKLDKNASFIVLTADHLISPADTFRERAQLAFQLVEQDPKRLVTFSIKPTYAATGFGYVERGPAISLGTRHSALGTAPLAFKVARFVEKPDAPRAQAYFESGHFGWNSGMFVFHAATFMDCLKRFKPESHEGLLKIQAAWGTKDQQQTINDIYPTLPRISVDYAIMEPASRDRDVSVCTINTDVDWLDVGSWPSYAETLEPDAANNRSGGTVKSIAVESSGTIITGESADPSKPHTIAVLGVKDLIIVHTKDATLVMPKSHAEQLKKLHGIVSDELK